jgi:hypothetical protein
MVPGRWCEGGEATGSAVPLPGQWQPASVMVWTRNTVQHTTRRDRRAGREGDDPAGGENDSDAGGKPEIHTLTDWWPVPSQNFSACE